MNQIFVISRKELWKAKTLLKKKYNLDSWLVGEIIKSKRRVEFIDL